MPRSARHRLRPRQEQLPGGASSKRAAFARLAPRSPKTRRDQACCAPRVSKSIWSANPFEQPLGPRTAAEAWGAADALAGLRRMQIPGDVPARLAGGFFPSSRRSPSRFTRMSARSRRCSWQFRLWIGAMLPALVGWHWSIRTRVRVFCAMRCCPCCGSMAFPQQLTWRTEMRLRVAVEEIAPKARPPRIHHGGLCRYDRLMPRRRVGAVHAAGIRTMRPPLPGVPMPLLLPGTGSPSHCRRGDRWVRGSCRCRCPRRFAGRLLFESSCAVCFRPFLSGRRRSPCRGTEFAVNLAFVETLGPQRLRSLTLSADALLFCAAARRGVARHRPPALPPFIFVLP